MPDVLSDLFRHDERFAIFTAEQARRFRISRYAVASRIEVQRSSDPVGNIRQVDQSGGDGAFFDGGVEIPLLARAQRRDEVRPVVADVLSGGARLGFAP